MKKFAAISLSAVLFLQPMAASAVTWGNIVNGLRNSGTNRYTEDGTTIEKDGENYTITGGTLTSDVDYSFLEETGDKTNILLKSLLYLLYPHVFKILLYIYIYIKILLQGLLRALPTHKKTHLCYIFLFRAEY